MDLDEYLWRTRQTQQDFSKKTGISTQSLSAYLHKVQSPKLLNAIKIHVASEGQITYPEMLTDKEKIELQKMCSTLNKESV